MTFETRRGLKFPAVVTGIEGAGAGSLAARGTGVLTIPPDRSPRRWVLELEISDLTSVCGRSQ